MNAQADSGARSTVSGNVGGGPGEGCTVQARVCTKSVCSPFLDEVAGRAHLEPCRRGKPPRL